MLPTYIPVRKVEAKNGVTYAYRWLGPVHGIPLVMQIHVRASMGWWDPAFIHPLTVKRPVILYDPPGVGESSGGNDRLPADVTEMGDDLNAFMDALSLDLVDLLGFSLGSFAAQMATLSRPERVRRLILVGSEPSAPTPGQHFWPRTEVDFRYSLKLLETPTEREWEEAYGAVFFRDDVHGAAAAAAYFKRIRQSALNEFASEGRLPFFNDMEGFAKQFDSIKNWRVPGDKTRHSYYRLHEISMPTLVINGDDDYIVPTSRSYELMDGTPNCQLVVWPRSGHASIWQYAENTAARVNEFLDSNPDNFSEPRL